MCKHSSHHSSGTICKWCFIATTPLTSKEGAHLYAAPARTSSPVSVWSLIRAFGTSRPHPPKSRTRGYLSSSTIHPTFKTLGFLVETHVMGWRPSLGLNDTYVAPNFPPATPIRHLWRGGGQLFNVRTIHHCLKKVKAFVIFF